MMWEESGKLGEVLSSIYQLKCQEKRQWIPSSMILWTISGWRARWWYYVSGGQGDLMEKIITKLWENTEFSQKAR